MKTLTVRLPEARVDQIETESRERGLSKSDVVRERLTRAGSADKKLPASYLAIADLIGSIKSGPADRGNRVKHYLKSTGYGRNHTR